MYLLTEYGEVTGLPYTTQLQCSRMTESRHLTPESTFLPISLVAFFRYWNLIFKFSDMSLQISVSLV